MDDEISSPNSFWSTRDLSCQCKGQEMALLGRADRRDEWQHSTTLSGLTTPAPSVRFFPTSDNRRMTRWLPKTALEQFLQMIQRRAIDIVALQSAPESCYELIQDACSRAAIQFGKSADDAVNTATEIVDFVRTIVGIVDAGADRN